MSRSLRWMTWTALPTAAVTALARKAFACPLCGDQSGTSSAGSSGGGELLVIVGLVAAGLFVMRGGRWLRARRWQRIEREAVGSSGKEAHEQ